MSRASLALVLTAQRPEQGTNTYDLCVGSTVTRLVIYPVTLCMTEPLRCKLHAVTFAVGARGASLHPSTTVKRLAIPLLWAFDHKLIPQSVSQLGWGSGNNRTSRKISIPTLHIVLNFNITTITFTNVNIKN